MPNATVQVRRAKSTYSLQSLPDMCRASMSLVPYFQNSGADEMIDPVAGGRLLELVDGRDTNTLVIFQDVTAHCPETRLYPP